MQLVASVIPENLTVEDVMKEAGSGLITQDQYLVLANAAMLETISQKEYKTAVDKAVHFQSTLKNYLETFKCPYQNGIITVWEKALDNSRCSVNLIAELNPGWFFAHGSDGYLYSAFIFSFNC